MSYRCLQISVVCIDAFLSDQFFFSPFVACCPSLYIRNAIQGFDSIALSNWILNLTIRRELEFDFFSIDSKGKEDFIKNIYMLLSTLKDEATKVKILIKNNLILNIELQLCCQFYNQGSQYGRIPYIWIWSSWKNWLSLF